MFLLHFRFIINLLESSMVPDTVDYEVRQEFYLQLLRVVWLALSYLLLSVIILICYCRYLLCGPDGVSQPVATAAASLSVSASSYNGDSVHTEQPHEDDGLACNAAVVCYKTNGSRGGLMLHSVVDDE